MAPIILFLIGAPGSGKGTLGRRLCNDHNMYHFSVGDYMREICRSDEPDAEIVRHHIKNATLLPGEKILPMLLRKMDAEQRKGGYRAILVDGFPRDVAQAISFEEQIGKPLVAIHLTCPKDEAKQRFLSRKLAEREEDTDEMFEKRYRQYEEKNLTIVERYREAGVLEEIDSSTETEQSYDTLIKTLQQNNSWRNLVEN